MKKNVTGLSSLTCSNGLLQKIINHFSRISESQAGTAASRARCKLNLLVGAWGATNYSMEYAQPLVQQCLDMDTPELGLGVALSSEGSLTQELSILIGRCHLKLGDFVAAKEAVKVFFLEGKASAVAFVADIALAQKRSEEAIGLLTQAIDLGDDNPRTKRLLAVLLFEGGEVDRAQALLKDIVENSRSVGVNSLLRVVNACQNIRQEFTANYSQQSHCVGDNVEKIFINDMQVAYLKEPNPFTLFRYATMGHRTVWDLSSTSIQDLTQLNSGLLTLAVSIAGAIICSQSQSRLIESLTSIAITPEISRDIACKVAANSIALGTGAGLGNMSKSKPAIRQLAQHLGHPIDVICHPSILGSEVIFTPNPAVAKAYGSLALATLKPYDKIFCTYNMGSCIPPFTSHNVYVQMRHCPIGNIARYLPEVHWNFRGMSDFFSGFPAFKQDEYSNWDIGSAYKFPADRIIGLCNSGKKGAWGNRRWPFFQELVGILKKEGYIVRSYGVPGEYILGSEDHTGLSLRQSIESLKECSFIIASDGGLLQLADSMGIPTVSLFGPTGITKNGPMSPFSRIVTAELPCSPCYWGEDFVCCKRPDCMEKISITRVLEALSDLEQNIFNSPYPVSQKTVPVRTLKTFEKESIRFLEQLSYTVSPKDLSENVVSEDLVVFMVQGWMQLHGHEQVRVLLDFYPTTENVALLKHKSYLERCLGNRNAEKATYQAIIKKEPTAIFYALKLADVYRRGREWGKYFELLDRLLEQYSERADILYEKGLGLLQCDHIQEAHTILNDAAQLKPQMREGVSLVLNTTFFRHRSERASIDTLEKACIGILLCRNEEISTCFRTMALYGYLYFYFPDEVTSFKADMHNFDLVLVSPQFGPVEEFCPIPQDRVIYFSYQSKTWVKQGLQKLRSKGFTPRKKKLVLLVAHHHLYRYGPHGGEFSQRRILKHMQQNDYDVLVLVPNRKNNVMGCETSQGVPFILGSYKNPLELLRWGCAGYFPDAIQVYGTSSLAMAALLKKISLPYMVFVRYWSAISNPPYIQGKEIETNKNDREFFAPLYEGASIVIGNAKHTCAVIREAFDVSCKVVYPPVDPPSSPPVKPSHKRKYITLINPVRGGGQYLLRSLALLLPDIPFQVYQQPTIPLPSNVTINPYHKGDYGEMFSEARVLLVPSHEANCGVSRVLSEAYYCKTPVVAANSGAISEFLPRKFLVNPEEGVSRWVDCVRTAYHTVLTQQDVRAMRQALQLVNPQRQLDTVLAIVDQVTGVER